VLAVVIVKELLPLPHGGRCQGVADTLLTAHLT